MMNDRTNDVALDSEDKRVFHRTWFKVWEDDILADMRVAGQSSDVFRRYIELLALANDDKTPGEIHADMGTVARMMRVTEATARKQIFVLVNNDLIFVEDDVVYICNPDRHYRGEGLRWSESPEGQAARKRNQRAREALAAQEASDCHGDIRSDGHGEVTTQKEYVNDNEYECDYEVGVRVPAVNTFPGHKEAVVTDTYSASRDVSDSIPPLDDQPSPEDEESFRAFFDLEMGESEIAYGDPVCAEEFD